MCRNKLAAVFLVFSLLTGQVFAAGKKSGAKKAEKKSALDDMSVGEDIMTLSQIDKLIKATKYDQALEELNKYIAEYPENFDNAQIRITRIMNARNRYSQLAEELIQLIIDEPDNSEKIYKVTYELEHLEKYPSDRQLAFIRETRIAAEFNYFRKEYVRIHEETEELISKGDYVAAAQKAREGFELYQERFFEEWEQEDVVVPVQDALKKIDDTLVSYVQIQKTLEDSVNEFIRSVNEEKQDEIAKSWQGVQTGFIELSFLRNSIYECGDVFKTVFEYTKELSEEELTDASFLPFVSRFTVGQTENKNTGIAGSIDAQWDKYMTRMKGTVDTKLGKYLSAFAETMPEKIMDSRKESLASENLPSIRQFSNLAVLVNSLNNQLQPAINAEETLVYDRDSKYAYSLPVKVDSLYGVRQNLKDKVSGVESIKAPEYPSNAELQNDRFTGNLLEAVATIGFSDSEKKEIEELSQFGIATENQTLSEMTRKFGNYTSELQSYAGEKIAAANRYFCDYVIDADEGYIDQNKKEIASADSFFNGSDEDKAIVERYPEKARDTASSVNERIGRQLNVINRHLALLPELTEKEMAAETETELKRCIQELESQRKHGNDIIASCKTLLQNAQRVKNEAEYRYNQAEIALQTDNFDTARRRLQESRTKYNEALALAFSLELQTESDRKLMQLGERINQKENEIVVRDVRELKTRAKNEYYAGNFEQAENLLTQASARWSVTNVEEDMEITGLRALVNTALSMKTGRVILPSAPLYPEMSQILSIAAQYYAEGEALIEKGNREEGEAELQHALQKIQEVQLVYPLNQEASLLSLRIQKILNPDDFSQMFSRKVAEAKANYKDKNKAQESYADLQDLYEINPKYPGLKDLIYNVELELGFRQKPVTKVVSNKSQDLTKEAQSIYNKAKGNETELRKALAKLDEAIALNENNTAAITLKDKIQVAIGGKASAVLSAEDESRYQKAIQEFQDNNLIVAYSIVEQLLQKQTNQNSTKILKLRKQIQARL